MKYAFAILLAALLLFSFGAGAQEAGVSQPYEGTGETVEGYNPSEPAEYVPPSEPLCGYQELVGKNIKDVDVEAIRDTGRAVRVLHPDTPVTRDYSPDRINIILEKDTDNIVQVTCG